MDSARFAIDMDDKFYLEHLPMINSLVENGLTLFVDKDFPDYHDMILTQYAIAKRKPKVLRFLLDKAKEVKIKEEDILYPKTSNTRGSLANLAIKFGSKSKYYDSEDNSCLKIILEFLSETNPKMLDIPLIEAVRNKNNEAINILIQNDANFFSPLDKETNNINDDIVLSEMPIMSLFKVCNNEEELANIFDNVIDKTISKEIIDRLANLKVKGREFISCLSSMEKAKNFCTLRIENHLKELKQLQNSMSNPQPPNPQPNNTNTPPSNSNSSAQVCSKCNKEKDDMELVDGKWICSSCPKS